MPRHEIEFDAAVLNNRRLNSQTVVLTLLAPEIARSARPGQFVAVGCGFTLRRPIGIMQVVRDAGQILLGIRIQGEGTRWLSERQTGERLSLLGPLGRGFALDGRRRIITVGGGTGVFPLNFVQQACREQAIDALAVCGYRSQNDSILTSEMAAWGCQTLFASDEGDMDVPGNAAQALEQLLTVIPAVPDTAVLTCGPKPMMRAVAAVAAQFGLPCQVSLEERMACGIGVCLVCACRVRGGSGQPDTYQRCCVDGPVFNAEDVVW